MDDRRQLAVPAGPNRTAGKQQRNEKHQRVLSAQRHARVPVTICISSQPVKMLSYHCGLGKSGEAWNIRLPIDIVNKNMVDARHIGEPPRVSFLRGAYAAVFPAAELLAGMGLAQAIATFQVHASNLRLYAKMKAAVAAGFQPVPNQVVMPSLGAWPTAFGGGVLFTLTVGAALALISAAAAWWWSGLAGGRRPAGAALLALWAAALVAVNLRGGDVWVSLYFLTIPSAVSAITLGFAAGGRRPPGRRLLLTRVLPVLILALGWSTQYDGNLMTDLRDHLLMANPVGAKVSSAYYRYTLYPAEVFKPLGQRQVKTVALDGPIPHGLRDPLARDLIAHDYLPVDPDTEPDLRVRAPGGRLVFAQDGRVLADLPTERFFSAPRETLAKISAAADRWAVFRGVTFLGVLAAFPVALFVVIFALLRVSFEAIAEDRRAETLAAAACLLLGIGILAAFHFSREPPPPEGGYEAALASGRWQRQVAALRQGSVRNRDLTAYPALGDLLHSPRPQVRYWLARALAESPGPQAAAALTRLLGDPHLNVRTMAIESLARHQRGAAADLIMRRLNTSPDWYEQLYAYRALRALGWSQRPPA